MNDAPAQPRFFFALPRFVARALGGSAARTEQNWIEANLVGTAIHLMAYLFAFQLLVRHLSPARQLLLALPLAILVWLGWLCVFYLNFCLIRLLRAGGWLRDLPQSRAQGVLIGTMTTGFAGWLSSLGGWPRLVGLLWLGAVMLNLLAALLLSCIPTHDARP